MSTYATRRESMNREKLSDATEAMILDAAIAAVRAPGEPIILIGATRTQASDLGDALAARGIHRTRFRTYSAVQPSKLRGACGLVFVDPYVWKTWPGAEMLRGVIGSIRPVGPANPPMGDPLVGQPSNG